MSSSRAAGLSSPCRIRKASEDSEGSSSELRAARFSRNSRRSGLTHAPCRRAAPDRDGVADIVRAEAGDAAAGEPRGADPEPEQGGPVDRHVGLAAPWLLGRFAPVIHLAPGGAGIPGVARPQLRLPAP